MRRISGRARQGRAAGERKKMIDRSHVLPLTGQGSALGISRGSVYYLARPTSDAGLALMRRIDELHLDHPFAGSRMLQGLLKAEGREVGRQHVATLMKMIGVEAIYRRPNTSKPAPEHKIYPYLLRNLAVTRPNQGYCNLTSGNSVRRQVRVHPGIPWSCNTTMERREWTDARIR